MQANNQLQPPAEVHPVVTRQTPDLISDHAGHSGAIARPCNSAPLLMPMCSFNTPTTAARPTLSTGHNCDPPSFDLGIDGVDTPPKEPAATEQHDPKEQIAYDGFWH
ncbi:unnamed protein product [Urochloa humidicola]